MKLSEMKANAEIVVQLIRSDSEFRAEWEGTASARALASATVRYRADLGLTQEGLAEVLGVSVAEVDHLELGEALPPGDVLARLNDLL